MSRNDNYTTRNLLDYLHHQKYYKLISINMYKGKQMQVFEN